MGNYIDVLQEPCRLCKKPGAVVVGHTRKEVDARRARGERSPCLKCYVKLLKAGALDEVLKPSGPGPR